MMPPSRIYPRWLPPTTPQRESLLLIRKRQRYAMLWIVGFIPASWVVIIVTQSDVMLVPFTILWLAYGAHLIHRVTVVRCPRCERDFFEKTQMPYFYGLFNRRCENCGLTLLSDNDSHI
jgi:hypothetical protein